MPASSSMFEGSQGRSQQHHDGPFVSVVLPAHCGDFLAQQQQAESGYCHVRVQACHACAGRSNSIVSSLLWVSGGNMAGRMRLIRALCAWWLSVELRPRTSSRLMVSS